ncbi:polysaccharide pyruvyl transferase [Prevotella sp. CAG:255]|uniref:polysaccharide pyruvyl transferase family protein n=1 Tax=Prevotella sp. CAG:255 TaxID=1262923 RepID=UPI00033FD75C|nr:polysaccharide pyruvyl transferase family protein [Prevotella sp. CAG:255]CCX68129.1 polysaccharide pyruvyl transferase [Prevotella sp. CAG:255]
MKIGILTHHFIANFGAFLQAYALQKAIERERPDDEVVIINYIHLKHFIINTGGWFRFYAGRETISEWLQKIRLPWTFFSARHKYMNLTRRCYSANDVNRLGLDVIVIGSDEVWNFKDTKSDAEIKFGKGLTCKRLVSYAPSVGDSTPDEDIPGYVTTGIKSFKAISVRDSLGQQLVKHITGKTPLKVLDPTFLIEFPVKEVKLPNKEYILFYYAENLPMHVKNQIFDYANEHGLAVYGAGECDKRYSAVTVNLTPFQWVWMFRNARFVITGTFHGVAFSIENERQFKVFLTQKNRIRKVNDLLETLGIENRGIDDNFVFDLERQEKEIDYKVVNERLRQKRKESLDFLRNEIE